MLNCFLKNFFKSASKFSAFKENLLLNSYIKQKAKKKKVETDTLV